MLWSTWQGTIWRGAMLVLLLWASLAWTQAPVPPAGAERIMIVHENGKATRCRVVESWQLPDRRIAHLLQSTETLEKITIVDEHAPTGDVGDVKNTRSMAKRIYAWGANRTTPPDGSPVPPNMRIETPVDTANSGPAIINKVGEEKLIANVSGTQPATNSRPAPKEQIKIEGQIVEFDPPVINVGGPAPLPSGVPATTNPPAIPQVNTLTPPVKSDDKGDASKNPRLVAQPIADPCPPIMHEGFPPGTIIETSRSSWRPGDKLQAWLLNRAAMKSEKIVHMEGSTIVTNEAPGASKTQFSTAMSTVEKKVESGPLAISKPAGTLPAPDSVKPGEKTDMWGNPMSAKPEPKVDPLLAPDRITPKEDIARPKAPIARPNEQWPLNSQSALAAKSGMQGPVVYVPYPIVTVPQPHQPPMPPDPKLPEAPQLNAFVNAFTPPPMPKGQANPGMMPQGNPMLAQQQMMQQQMMHQQMMQQQMMARQYGQPMPSQGPMANGSRQYQGPMPPNLIPGSGPMQAGYIQPPMMMPQQPMLQPIAYQQPGIAQQSPVMQQIDQLIKAMREAPYPGQREWAAQQLVNFDWRANPLIIHAMLQSASHDPAVSVRAGCVYCLGRMQASVEPVLGALNGMRNDGEPRVRQEVEQALVRLGQTPAAQ